MNQIPIDKENQVASMLESGKSIRAVAISCVVHKNTVASISKKMGLDAPRVRYRWTKKEPEKRIRTAYLRNYYGGKNQYQRLLLNERRRACVGLWLAKNDKPQSLDKIYEAMVVQFPDFKKSSLSYMLGANVEETFKKVGDKWTYSLNPWYIPHLKINRPDYVPERDAARAIYCQRTGTRDAVTEVITKQLLEAQKQFVIKTQQESIEKSMPLLQLMATATAITNLK